MDIPGLGLISSYWKQKPTSKSRHLMLAGIHQGVFLNQWGHPEIQIAVAHFSDPWGRLLPLGMDTSPEGLRSVWIYKKMNKVLFFTKKRLVSHLTWRGFEEKSWSAEMKSETAENSMASVISRLRRVA
jgi:hypothetical protein